jgi:L,D-transpeptidase ErfK/SrfK
MKPSVILTVAVLAYAMPAGGTVWELRADRPEVFGAVDRIQASYEDTLVDIARRYSLGYEEITRVNAELDPWLPGVGAEIVVPGRRILPPGPREGIVVNLPEHRLYYYPPPVEGEKPVVYTYPVSIGKMDWRTPIGETKIVGKQKNPSWHPPESVRQEHAARGEPLPAVVKAGPENPLGEYAMRLAITPGAYLIHGTNNPLAVGMAVTHGCIRMYPEDIAALFPLVPVGTKVFLVNEPVKIAYVDGELLLEAHPPVDAQGQSTVPDVDALAQRLDAVLGETTAAIHWDLALATLRAARGIPAVVGIATVADPDAEPWAEATASEAGQEEAQDEAKTAAAPAAPVSR